MKLQPKRVKYRKVHLGRIRGKASRGIRLSFGDYGLAAQEGGWLTARQLEAARIAIVRSIGDEGRLWVRVFPDKSVTKKPLETRMGKGKGEPAFWVAVIRPGRILFEVAGADKERTMEAFRLASHKLPFKTTLISSNEVLL